MSANTPQTEGIQLVTLNKLVGHTLSGAYRLERVIGEGGMGIVFEATQLKLGRAVALKVLKLDGPNAQEAFARFERELEILSNLSHPNIVRVLDSGHDPGLDLYYLAMDLVTGKPLGDLADGFRFEPSLALEIIYQLCGALAQPHAEGVIHRDLKPDNVLLEVIADETVQVRLVDFGIARAFAADKKLTATGVVVGTPHYMAPELVREKGMDLRTDIYALGVMLHELLSGSLPYDGGNFMQIGFKHIQSAIPTIGSKVPGFDNQDLEELVAKMMAKEKEDRFESVSAVRRAIEDIIDEHRLSRVRVDPGVDIEKSLAPYRHESDGRSTSAESAQWLPPQTPSASDNPRDAAVHKPITTTSIEGTAPPSKAPILIALIAVVVAVIAVIIASGMVLNRGEGVGEQPTELGNQAIETTAVAPAETTAEAAPPVEEPVVAAAPDAGDQDAGSVVETDPEPLKEPTKVVRKPRKTDDKNHVKKPAKTTKTANEKDEFEEALDWVKSTN